MRTCGCGKRGRHKPTCIEITKPKIVIEKPKSLPRSCGCGTRGRHKKECSLRPSPPTDNIIHEETLESTSLYKLYIQGYGKPPHLTWFRTKSRQITVERRINSLVRRNKAFYLKIVDEDEVWFVDAGNWTSRISSEGKYNLIGHIKNILPFLHGVHPIPWGEWNKIPEEIKPKRRKII